MGLTADQVLHDGDVVSRSDGFGTTATRLSVVPCASVFLDEPVKAGSLPPLLWELLIRRRELSDISSRDVFITTCRLFPL